MVSLISNKDHLGFPEFHTTILKYVLVCELSRSFWKPKLKISEKFLIN